MFEVFHRESFKVCAIFISISLILLPVLYLNVPKAYAVGEKISLGMPFDGTWAYDIPTTLACGTTAHPSCHGTNGDDLLGYHWAVDYYATDGTSVLISGSSSYGTVTFSSTSSSGSCGDSLVITSTVNGVNVGQMYVTHLNNAVVSSSIASGSSIGTVKNECFGVDHTHWSYKNLVSNYSCYINHSNSTYTAGMSIAAGTTVGIVGSSNNGTRQVCASESSSGTRLILGGLDANQSPNNVFTRKEVDNYGNWESSWTGLSGSFGEMDMATTSDGRRAIVALNTSVSPGNNNVYVRKQVDTNGNWESSWTGLSGYLTRVSVAFDGNNKLVLAGVNSGTGNNIYVRKQVDTNGNWESSWTGLSGHATELDVVATSDGKAGLAVANTDLSPGNNNVYVRKQVDTNGNWESSWNTLAGYLSKISVAYDSSNKMTIAGVDASQSSDNVRVRKQVDTNGNWQSSWVSLSGRFDNLDIMSTSDNKTGIAVINTQLTSGPNIFTRKQVDTNGNWQSSWITLSGYLTSISAAKY